MKTQPQSCQIFPHEGILSAWRDQLAEAAENPSLSQQILRREQELYPRFVAHYTQLRHLPRRVRRSLQRRWKQSLAGVALLLVLGQAPAFGATINVGGDCRLAAAIRAANADAARGECPAGNGADSIVLPRHSTQTLTRVNNRVSGTGGSTVAGPNGLPVIRSDITINGRGSTIRRAGGAPEFRIFAVSDAGDLTLRQTTVTGGRLTDASGSGYAIDGGGIFAFGYGSLTVNRCTISGNRAEEGGGLGTYSAALKVINSTISDNRAEEGGGVYNYTGNIRLRHSTLSGNTAAEGGGVYAQYAAVTLQRSLVSGNTASNGSEIYARNADAVTAGNFNVLGHRGLTNADAFFNFTPRPTDITATSDGNRRTALAAILDTDLADNGGPTRTHALVGGSPAVNAVQDTCPPPATDQRGISRPRDTFCDTGAFERRRRD